ncbi:MAG: adenylate/guanylate cyclase domain-containing protein [Candidatus Ozemobacteraceae bacterium]
MNSRLLFLFWFLIATLMSAGTYILIQDDADRSASGHERLLEHRRACLPLLRGRSDVIVMVEERLLACISGIRSFSAASVQLIARRLDRDFSGKIRFAIFDRHRNVMLSRNFPKTKQQALRDFFFTVVEREGSAAQASASEVLVGPTLHRLFGRLETRIRHNWVDVQPVHMLGESGFFLSAPIMDHIRPDLGQWKWRNLVDLDNTRPHPEPSGCVGAFVPLRLINQSWLERMFRRHSGLFPTPLKVGNLERRVSRSALPESLRNRLLESMKRHSQDVMIEGNMLAGFCRFPHLPTRGIFFFHHIPGNEALSRTCIVLLAGSLLLSAWSLAVFRRSKGEPGGAPSVGRKCAMLLSLAVLVPTIGFALTASGARERERLAFLEDGFARLDARLLRIEQENALAMGETSAESKRLLAELRAPRQLPTPAETQKLIVRHPLLHLIMMFYSARNMKEPALINVASGSQEEILIPFLNALTENADLKPESMKMRKSDAFQSLIFDLAISLFGAEGLYRLFLEQDCLLSLRFFDDSAWSYTHISPETPGKAPFLAFLTYDLTKIKRLAALTALRQDGPERVPSITLCLPARYRISFYPERASRYPFIRQIITRIVLEGGIQKLVLRIGGRPYQLLARPLSGLEFTGLALAPLPPNESRLGIEMAVATAYPLIVGVLLLMMFGSFYLKPVMALGRAVDGIAAGDVSRRVPIVSNDELGDLCRGFNRMAEGLAEKELLRRFLSDLTLEAVTKGDDRGQATRVRAAILFSDIRGFTTLAEQHTPEEVTAMLNRYFTRMESAIEAQAGSIDKFIGDAIMAVFLPVLGRPDVAIRAVDAALAMRTELAGFNQERTSEGRFTIKAGVGIAVGEVLLGMLGRPDGRRDFTVTGPTVNLAARMEKRSKEASHTFITICPATAAMVFSADHRKGVILPEHSDSPTAYEILE